METEKGDGVMKYGLLLWFVLMAAGLGASVLLIFRGHESGRFADHERARFLSLQDDEQQPVDESRRTFFPEAYALLALMALTGIGLALTLGVAILGR